MKKQILGPSIITSAIIWGVTLIGTSLMMGDVEKAPIIMSMLSSAAGMHLILVWGLLGAALSKFMKQQEDEQSK
jgi:hypothetical protein